MSVRAQVASKEEGLRRAVGLMRGMQSSMGVEPGRHYWPTLHNASRSYVLRLRRANPSMLPQLRSKATQLTLWAGLDDSHLLRIGFSGYAINLEIPKVEPLTWKEVTVEQLGYRRAYRPGRVVLGIGQQDEVVSVDVREDTSGHWLIAGATRSGKTTLQRTIAHSVARTFSPKEAVLLLVDTAKRQYRWGDFGGLVHLGHPLVVEPDEAERLLMWAVAEIGRRADRGRRIPYVFIFIDELRTLAEQSRSAMALLSQIARLGAEFGVFLVLATQYPQIQDLGGEASLKRNLVYRLCGRVDDASASTNILGGNHGAERLVGSGDFLMSAGEVTRLTATNLQAHDVDALPTTGEPRTLDLPGATDLLNADAVGGQAHPLEPEVVARQIWDRVGIKRLMAEYSMGRPKALRHRDFADRIVQWAQEHGHLEMDHAG